MFSLVVRRSAALLPSVGIQWRFNELATIDLKVTRLPSDVQMGKGKAPAVSVNRVNVPRAKS